MKKVFVQPISVSNGRYAYDLLDLNGGFAGSSEFKYATLGEAYEAGICHVQEFPKSFTLVSPAEVAALLKDAYYHLHTLLLIEAADPRLPESEGLHRTYFQIKALLNL